MGAKGFTATSGALLLVRIQSISGGRQDRSGLKLAFAEERSWKGLEKGGRLGH
jgi:hypothetical protein